ncbi:MAG: synthetase [Gammaproteobacteria bacterium]|jgi:NAD+ synthase (glutamine-hydrolysing)|nr:synthetase [Gammaproteobacteria bacterium]
MSDRLKIVMAQLNFLVGDIGGNAQTIIAAIREAKEKHHADLIIFPELALSGYPPEDLLYRPDLHERIKNVLPSILASSLGINVILGLPWKEANQYYNQAVVISSGKIAYRYNKQKLPNYSVFDEKRYFTPGDSPCVVDIHGVKVGIAICEDLWFPEPIAALKQAGAELIVSINASPFAKGKINKRVEVIAQRAIETRVPIIYVNMVGAQDQLVFDGGSMILDDKGNVLLYINNFNKKLEMSEFKLKKRIFCIAGDHPFSKTSDVSLIYQALVLGVRDYLQKNHFSRALIGLSGGIDSALTLAIAVDALGKNNVEAIMMPSRYTTTLSLKEAEAQAKLLGVQYQVLPIEPIYQVFLKTLSPMFTNKPIDTTEENLQARCRGTLLMAISNKTRALVLATSNKSEMAVGYSTLYGDMVGGFCVLKDVFKTLVYQLARWRNEQSPAIPQAVIDRPPSAELAENQKDEDSLPPYPMLDAILEKYIERDESIESIVQAGFDRELVLKISKMVDRNEYKRQQSAPGVRITEHAFGKDRRYPITSGF